MTRLQPRCWIGLLIATATLASCATPTHDRRDIPGLITPVPPSTHSAPDSTPTALLPQAEAAVDTTNPDAVATAVVAILNTYDTRTDTNPGAAVRRAQALLTPELTTALASGYHRTGNDWLDLEHHDGYTQTTTALVNEYGQPVNTVTAALAQVSVTVHFIGRDGWTATEQARIVRVQLERTSADQSWLVSGFPS